MENFNFCSPTYFAFGKASEQRLGELTKRYGGSKVLLHYGQQSVVKNGLLDLAKKSLDREGIAHVELGGALPNPRADLVYQGIDLCRRESVDFIIGLGGGSAIDSAKAIAVGVCYEGDFWDLYEGKADTTKALPVACVLTLAATGTEGSNSSVINKQDEGKKYGLSSELIRPVFSIMNPEYTYSLPAYQTACGIVDMLSHILERYLSNTTEVDLTDRLCEAVMKTLIENGRKAMAKPDDYGARANLMWSGTIAHNNLLGLGREQDWSSHQMEHELSALYDVAHGAGLAVVFPAFMTYTMPKHLWRFVQLADRVWGKEVDYENPKRTALAGIKAFRDYFKELGMPTTFEELGAKEEDIPYLASRVRIKSQSGKLGNFEPLTREQVADVYRLMLAKNQ